LIQIKVCRWLPSLSREQPDPPRLTQLPIEWAARVVPAGSGHDVLKVIIEGSRFAFRATRLALRAPALKSIEPASPEWLVDPSQIRLVLPN
jgi:hypothetical protein